MASKKLSSDTSLANSYKLSRGVASVARPSAPTIGTATDGGSGNMSVTFTASTLGPTASSYALTSSSGVTGSGASSPLTLQEVATGTYTYSVSGVNANGTGPSSAASNSVVVASVDSSAYFPIATTTLSTATSTVTFSSIPATYTHLQIRFLIQSNRASANSGDFEGIRFNSDTGNNYVYGHQLSGDGASATSYFNGANGSQIYVERIGNYETDANAFTGGVVDILDYGNTNKYKTTRTLIGYSTNTAYTQVNFASGVWMSNTAISSISLTMLNGQHTQNSSYALYGIKG